MSLYRKYRPQKFNDLVGQDHIRDTLLQAVKDNQISHAYLFTGPRGTGKTTAARLIAKVANCHEILESIKSGKTSSGEPCNNCESCKDILSNKSIDIIEIDAASNRGIDEIRELRENVKFTPAKSKYKVYIIDEVHMLTKEAFNALLKTLEEPPAHAIFILATTEAHKVPATIVSRTQRFDFHRIGKDDLKKNLEKIAKAEKIDIEPEAISLIISAAEGGHRDAISLLDQVSGIEKKVSAESVRNILGLVPSEEVFALLGAIFNTNPEEGLKIAHRLFETGHDMANLNKQIIETLRRILLFLMSEKFLFEDTKENEIAIKKTCEELNESGGSTAKITALIDVFIESGKLLKDVNMPILPIEIAIVEGSVLFEKMPKDKLQMTNKISNPNVQDPKTDSHSDQSASWRRAEESPKEPDRNNFQKISPSHSAEVSRDKQNLDDKKEELENRNEKIEMGEEKKTTSHNSHPAKPAEVTSAPVIEMTLDSWQKIIAEIKNENTSLAALLRDSKPVALEGEKMILGVKFPFHKDKISEPKNIQIIEETIKKLTGKTYIVEVKIADLRAKPKEKASDDELQKAAEEIFS